MVRWRFCLFLAMLLILPVKAPPNLDDDDDDSKIVEDQKRYAKKGKSGIQFSKIIPSRLDDEEDEEDVDDDEDDEPAEKMDIIPSGRRSPALIATTPLPETTRAPVRRALECYVCAFKAETQLRSCLDPNKYRVHTMICHSAEDKCFTSVMSKGSNYEAVMRGCRSGCVGTSETTCCELNRCNNQALVMPVAAPRALTTVAATSKSNKPIPPSILFFVTILLVLQTVVKVPLV